MPYYNDVPYYYGGGTYSNHSSLMTGTGRIPFHTPLSRFSPHLSTISESPHLNHLHRFPVRSPPITSVRSHARRVIDTADIDVSSPRILPQSGNRPRNRLQRNRPTIKIRSQALKDNPVLREHNEKHEKSVGELLMEKFFIKDKKLNGDGGQQQQVRLYHQVNLNRQEEPQEQEEAVQRRITRRFTRRRSSADLQLNPEQLQRKATYAQVQAKVLDSLVAEEQAQIENEVRRGTLMRKETGIRSSIHSYYTDSDAISQDEEEKQATTRIRKAAKTKRKKKSVVDKPWPGDNRRSSSSDMSIDSEIEEESNGPKPQMYKIEACNSAGDFSTIWVNAGSENEKRKSMVEQFRESAKVPTPRILEAEIDASPKNSTDEAEMQIVLPVRKPYALDSSRNSVYLTVKKPTEKLDEKLEKIESLGQEIQQSENQLSLTNGFVDVKNNVPKDNEKLKSLTSNKDSLESNDEVKTTSDAKDLTSNKVTDDSKQLETSKNNSGIPSKMPKINNSDIRKTDLKQSATFPKTAEPIVNSIQSSASSEFISPNKLSKNVITDLKKDKGQKNENNSINVTKNLKLSTTETPEFLSAKDSFPSKTDKPMQEEDKPKSLAMLREDTVVMIEADDNARENSANSATCRLPKASKINADRNNVVEAPELSLRDAAQYLANPPESVEEETVTLPEKKVNKASGLAKTPFFKPNSVDTSKPASASKIAPIRGNDDTANLVTAETTLLKEMNGEVRNNDRNEEPKSITTDVKQDLTKTPRNKIEKPLRKLSIKKTTDSPKVDAEINATEKSAPKDSTPLKIDVKKISSDVKKDSSDLPNLKNKAAPRLDVAKPKVPFKMKNVPKPAVNEADKLSSKVKKESDTVEVAKINDDKPISVPKKDLDEPKILKKTILNNCLSNNLPNLQQSVSVDEKTGGKSVPIKKTLEPAKLLNNKATDKKPVIVDAGYDKSQEKGGQLSKSASTESIDFWSEIKATSDPEEIKSKRESGFPSREPAITKVDDSTNPSNLFNHTLVRKKSVIVKKLDDKKDKGELDNSVVEPRSLIAEEKNENKEKVVLQFPKVKKEEAVKPVKITGNEKNVPKMPLKKKKNLPTAIGANKDSGIKDSGIKDSGIRSSTLKKAPSKNDDSNSISTQSDTTPAASEASPSIPEVMVCIINNLGEEFKLAEEPKDREIDEGNLSTPTNEPASDLFTGKISKWSNQDNLTNADDVETPIASEDTSLVPSPNPSINSQSFKTKRSVKKKKKQSSSKKAPSTKSEKEPKSRNRESTSQQNTLVPEKQFLGKPLPRTSPSTSPRNSPSQRPLDLIRMFYTTPSALLTATPRDLTKIRRAKIKRRRHHSKASSVNSDSTGSTTSTATTGSTNGSGSTCVELDEESEHKRMNSTRSNDSGFDGSPRILTPSQSSDHNQRNSDISDRYPSGRITPPATNLPRFKKYAVTDFNFLKVLGKGSFGKVLLAELCGTECVYAVKCLKKDVVLEDDDVECTLIERKVLTLATRHPYLCHLFCTFQTESHLFFVMEYLNGGDLMFHIQKSGRFAESRARFYAAEIWSGLSFLHKKGIVYRDLKLDNVLLDFEGHIRIADFGMCKLQIFLDRMADTFCGTPDYMAPEIIKGLKYNHAVDWWSYGVLLYEMLTGQSPFSGCDEDELFWSICNERPFIPRYLSQEATDILISLLEKDSGKRPPAHEIAMHAFFQSLPWDRLERRQLEPPFKPALDHTLDTKYFDTAFTTERPRLTPVPEQILTSMDQDVFRGFSYTNPNATD